MSRYVQIYLKLILHISANRHIALGL